MACSLGRDPDADGESPERHIPSLPSENRRGFRRACGGLHQAGAFERSELQPHHRNGAVVGYGAVL